MDMPEYIQTMNIAHLDVLAEERKKAHDDALKKNK